MATKKSPARSVTQLRIHDMVIASLASQYQARGYTVHTNQNQQKNWSIGGAVAAEPTAPTAPSGGAR